MIDLIDVQEFNREFMELVRQAPRSSYLSQANHAVISWINCLSDKKIPLLLEQQKNLCFTVKISPSSFPLPNNEPPPEWLASYWISVAAFAKLLPQRKFCTCTGLSPEMYQELQRKTAQQVMEDYYPHTVLEIRHSRTHWSLAISRLEHQDQGYFPGSAVFSLVEATRPLLLSTGG